MRDPKDKITPQVGYKYEWFGRFGRYIQTLAEIDTERNVGILEGRPGKIEMKLDRLALEDGVRLVTNSMHQYNEDLNTVLDYWGVAIPPTEAEEAYERVREFHNA